MEKITRQSLSQEQKKDLDMLSSYVRQYLERWYKRDNQRHSKTIIKFEGDRYKPSEIEVHFRKGGKI